VKDELLSVEAVVSEEEGFFNQDRTGAFGQSRVRAKHLVWKDESRGGHVSWVVCMK
jgi:hypothetical protein